MHEQHGQCGPLEGQVDCNSVPATAAQNSEARTNCPRDASKAHTNDDCLDLRHAVVRLVARISVLEARLLQNTDPAGEQENTLIEGESEVPLFPGTGLLGMWQAYLGAGCVPRSRVGVQVRAVPTPLAPSAEPRAKPKQTRISLKSSKRQSCPEKPHFWCVVVRCAMLMQQVLVDTFVKLQPCP